jgi:hypothetical protein
MRVSKSILGGHRMSCSRACHRAAPHAYPGRRAKTSLDLHICQSQAGPAANQHHQQRRTYSNGFKDANNTASATTPPRQRAHVRPNVALGQILSVKKQPATVFSSVPDQVSGSPLSLSLQVEHGSLEGPKPSGFFSVVLASRDNASAPVRSLQRRPGTAS